MYEGCVLVLVVSMGTVPSESSLQGTRIFRMGMHDDGGSASEANLAHRAASLIALVAAKDQNPLSKSLSRVWLGDGLGVVAKRVHEKMLKWEYIDLWELKPKTGYERDVAESETEKLVVLPGFEVAQTKKRPITCISTWVQCFARYTAAMAQSFPASMAGFMSHMLVVLKAFKEIEEPGWRLYDEAFREKMAATGSRRWKGMDVQVYQETCGSLPRRCMISWRETQQGRVLKRPLSSSHQKICWSFNDGICSFGTTCKFHHKCDICGGPHGRRDCAKSKGPKRPTL